MKVSLAPKNLDIIVSSYGGTGSTFFMEFLSRFKMINHKYDVENLKHTPYPPFSIVPSQKFIYLFGNPVHATISLFRRKFHHLQSIKVQEGSQTNSPIPKEMTLEEYASEGIDKFGFADHFHNWYQAECMNQILFVRYETLFENLSPILDFAQLPKSAIDVFPQKRKRESLEMNIPKQTYRQLQNMYGDFLNELERLPDIEIRGGKKMSPFEMTFHISRFYSIYGWHRLRKNTKWLLYHNSKNNQS